VVTLNHFRPCNMLNLGVAFMVLADFADNNDWMLGQRCSLNQNNAIGVHLSGLNNYFNLFPCLQIDTFAGKTGRQAIVMDTSTSRHDIVLFNDPAAEGGSIVDSGAQAYRAFGEWQASGAASFALSTQLRNVAPLSAVQTLTFPGGGGAVAVDAGRIGEIGMFALTMTDGTAFTISNPTNLSIGQILGLTLINAGGITGAPSLGTNYNHKTGTIAPAASQQVTMWFYTPDGTHLTQIGPVSPSMA